jgi:hypothetical protein
MHHGSSKYFFYSNRKRLLQIPVASFTQEHEQNGREREEWERFGHNKFTQRIDDEMREGRQE